MKLTSNFKQEFE